MSDELKRTVRLRRIPKVADDEHGHSVWTKPVETGEFELVSTVMLKRMLTSEDKRLRLQKASEKKEGYLVRSTDDEDFAVIDDEDLQAALSSAADTAQPADVTYEPLVETDDGEELSLVSTQMLRRMLSGDDAAQDEDDATIDEGGGFDPYDHS